MFRMTALFVVERNKVQLLAELFKLLKLSAQASRHASLARGSRGGAMRGTQNNPNFQLQVLVFGGVMLCCAVPCCPRLCCAVLSCVAPCCAMLCCVAPCCAVLCCAALLHAVLCCAVSCCPRLCCAMLYYAGQMMLQKPALQDRTLEQMVSWPPSFLSRYSSSSRHSCTTKDQNKLQLKLAALWRVQAK